MPPVDARAVLIASAHQFGQIHTQHEGQKREEVVQRTSGVTGCEVLTEQDDVAGLGVGEYLAAAVVRVRVLKSARKRQKDRERERIGHLFFHGGHILIRDKRGYFYRVLLYAGRPARASAAEGTKKDGRTAKTGENQLENIGNV